MSWDKFYEVALGVLQLSLDEFFKLRPREFFLAIKGYNHKRRESWEMVRMLSYYSAAPMAGKGFSIDKIRTPFDPPPKMIPIKYKRFDKDSRL